MLRQIFTERDNQHLCRYNIISRTAACCQESFLQPVLRNYSIGNLCLCQKLPCRFKRHPCPGPFPAGVIQYADLPQRTSALYQMTDPVHIMHQIPEIRVLRIIPSGIEVRRTIPVRKIFHGERMGHIIIYPPDQHMIRQPFHQLQPLRPSVGAIQFAHGTPLFLRVQICQAHPHSRQPIVEKSTIIGSLSAYSMKTAFSISRPDLLQHHIYPCHVLPHKGTEIMSRSQSQPGMAAIVLNHMSNIFHAVLSAPVTDLSAEILPIQLCSQIHEFHPGSGRNTLRFAEQRSQPDTICFLPPHL